MGSPPANPDLSFSQADIAVELNPEHNVLVQADPTASEVNLKVQTETQPKKKGKKSKDGLQTLKKAIIVSGIVVALAGVAFAVTKKLKEK